MSPMYPSPRKRRPALALACAGALLPICAPAAAAEPHDLFPAPVYVTLQAAGAVEDLSAGGSWDALDSAHYDAVSPDGTRLLVGSKDRPEVYLVDTSSGR